MGNGAFQKYPKKTLSDSPNANLRPLHNSNVAKVSIVKWSQILIFMDKSPVSGKAHFFKKALKTQIIDNFGYARNGISGSVNQNLSSLNNRYFCHITIMK